MSTIARKFALAFLTILAASAARADSINWLTDSTTGYNLQITGSSVDDGASFPGSIDSPSGLWNFEGEGFWIDPNYSPGVAHLLGDEIYISLLAERSGAFNFSSFGTIENIFSDQSSSGSINIPLPLRFNGFTPSIGTSWTTTNSLTISWDSSLSNGFNYVAAFSASGPAAVTVPDAGPSAWILAAVLFAVTARGVSFRRRLTA
jgi:hypothetical protein